MGRKIASISRSFWLAHGGVLGLACVIMLVVLVTAGGILSPVVDAVGRNAQTDDTTQVNGVVAILTDFGNDDFLGGALNGSILLANPDTRVVSISNEVPSFAVREGAFWLQQAARRYPPGTVILAIVDPTIATAASRKLVVETNDGKIFVGPDNGLLSFALQDAGVRHAYALTRPELMAESALALSPSFDRDVYDIFGNAAGRLAGGAKPSDAGQEVQDWMRFTVQPGRIEANGLKGEVMHVDHFGNLSTNINADLVKEGKLKLGQSVAVTVGNRGATATFARAFGDVTVNEFLIYLDGTTLKLAVNSASAAQELDAQAGDPVTVELVQP